MKGINKMRVQMWISGRPPTSGHVFCVPGPWNASVQPEDVSMSAQMRMKWCYHIYIYIYIYTYLLTPWCRVLLEKLTGLQLVKKIPRISLNPKVHYRTHKRLPPVSILGQPSPVHIPTSHLLKIHPNIIHPSTPRSPLWSPSLRFPEQDPNIYIVH